ncbi:sesquipedalian-1 [Latimeria chalumnae]|uniref:Sesquipedalian n=1 Tax=Latimeria chalumnae TaxID=7897 RepID=H3AHP3_LATCH|nr:PREDICTED: sesquipedalian-1-like [Latimeria chalumnae]XP_006009083.1 PREDICTED: sesquipedalian-1-like [Latimeria chalumnae]|eukprot:XP_006009082.1 PREDICTED: sesquipedalian-1-like [Latimeria chalumnae]
MKIHERNMVSYATCNSPVDKEGFLWKKGEVNTSYQKRWFVLKGNHLFYFERKGDRDPVGVIVLEDCSIQLCESDEEFAFAVVFAGAGLRTYKLSAEDEPTLESWVKALSTANFGYIKMLVQDLEKQYEEACRSANTSPTTQRYTVLGIPEPSLHQKASSMDNLDKPSNNHTGHGANEVRDVRSYSMNVPKLSAAKLTKRSPKLWNKKAGAQARQNVAGPGPPQQETFKSFFPAEGDELCSQLTEAFASLHEQFGVEIKELQRAWREKKGLLSQPVTGDLIDLG